MPFFFCGVDKVLDQDLLSLLPLQVQFSAVNCWWSEGECRKRYKFLMFPILMVYHTKLDGYRFTGKHTVDVFFFFFSGICFL